MDSERFKELLDELDGNSLQTLKEKNAKYAQNGDCLHNFRSGADIMGRTPAQACWGYMTKHLTALRDKVEQDNFSDREDFLEKCQDTINYIRFLWCIGNDGGEETDDSASHIYEFGFGTRAKAEEFIDSVISHFKNHNGCISAEDTKHIFGVESGCLQDSWYGWKKLDHITHDNCIRYENGSYIVRLPKAENILEMKESK